MCQEYGDKLRTTCKGARDFDKWELALCQHPMLLLIKEDELCAEREADWGGDLDEHYRRLKRNLELVEIHPSLRLCYDFAVVELELVRDERPDLYEKFKENLRKHRIAFVNGGYSQAHLQVMGHESCYRQIEEGCRTMREMFGSHPRTYATQEPCYIEQLPQILKAFGYSHAAPSHFMWSLKFLSPHELLHFRGRMNFLEGEEFTNWTAPDGSSIPLYLADVGGPLHGFLKDEGIYWEYHKDLLRAPTLRIGYPDLIDLPDGWLEENERNGRTVLIDDALDERLRKYPAESSARIIPTFSYHAEGVDGSRLNVLNRRAEMLMNQLRAVETVMDLEGLWKVRGYRHLWKLILKAQHHDAYWPGGPGLRKKAEGWLYNISNELAKRTKRRVEIIGKNVKTGKSGTRLIVFNTIPARRTGVVRASVSANVEHFVSGSGGRELPCQIVPVLGNEFAHEALAVTRFDGLGYKSFHVERGRKKPKFREIRQSVVFRNRYYSCRINPDLTFSSVVCSQTGERLLRKGSVGNELRGLAQDGKWMTTKGNAGRTLLSEGATGKVLTTSFNFPKGKIAMRATLLNDLPWIEIEAVVDADGLSVGEYWKDMSKLCVVWPLASADSIRYEVPFGYTEGRERRPLIALGWVSIGLGKSAFSYFNAGTPKHFVDDGVLHNVIAWGADTDNFNSRVYGSMKYSKKFDLSLHGRYHYRWAVMPHSSKMSAGETANLCRSWMEPPVAVITEGSNGRLKESANYFRVGRDLVPVSVEKQRGKRGEIRIMVFEPNGRKVEVKVRNSLRDRKSSAELLDGTKLRSFAPHKIGWVRLSKVK